MLPFRSYANATPDLWGSRVTPYHPPLLPSLDAMLRSGRHTTFINVDTPPSPRTIRGAADNGVVPVHIAEVDTGFREVPFPSPPRPPSVSTLSLEIRTRDPLNDVRIPI